MRPIGVNISEFDWYVNRVNDKSEKILHVFWRAEGLKIIQVVCPFDVDDASELDPEEKKFMLNVWLTAYMMGQRHGAEDKVEEIKKALGL